MKIAIFTDTFLPQTNGVVQSILNNIEYFTRKRHKVWVFAPGKKYEVERKKKFKIFRTFSLPFFGNREYRIASITFDRLKQIFEKEHFDIIHCHTQFYMGVNGLILSKEYKIPAVSTYHTLFESYSHYSDPFPLPRALTDLRNRSLYYYLRKFHGAFYKTIVPSKIISNYLAAKRQIDSIVIPNSITRLKSHGRKCICAKYGIPSNAKILLFVGRLGKEKSIDILLKAFKLIASLNYYLIIAGYGPEVRSLQDYIEQNNLSKSVILTGRFSDELKGGLYYSCTAFVSASDSEVFPMTHLEALAAGKPIVGVNRGGVIELVTDGENGFLVEPGAVRDLAERMKLLLSNAKLAKRMGRASRKLAKQYSIKTIGKQMLALYKEAIKNHDVTAGVRSTFLRFIITRDPRTLKQAFKRLQERLESTVIIN